MIPIESRAVCGFNPTSGSGNRYVLRERAGVVNGAVLPKKMDVYPVLFRIDGNWTEYV